jgi:hypothetical protein
VALRTVQLRSIGFPEDSDDIALGTGTDTVTGEHLRVVVPPDAILKALAHLQAGRQPVVRLHEFDVVDWTAWWSEAPLTPSPR